jgi:hypothetical protein
MQADKTSNKQVLTGLFKDRQSVEGAYNTAIKRGYDPKEINVVMSDDTRKRHFLNQDGTTTVLGDKSMEGLAMGSALGGTIAGVASAIAAIGTALVIPGLGLVVAGPLAAGLAGAGAGGLAGGLVGALIGWGIPEERVKEYEAGIKSGGILMAVRSRSEQDTKDLAADWKKYHSDNTQY